jgi:hypothetical protein
LAASLALAGCDLPGAASGDPPREGDKAAPGLDAAARASTSQFFRDLLAAQQARQQVNVTTTTLIADNSAGLLSNHGASLTRNAPLITNNGASLISNGGSSYRLAATVDRETEPQYIPMADGQHFYRLTNLQKTFVETFVTRTPNVTSPGFSMNEADILVHGVMDVTLPDWDGDPFLALDGGTTRYAIAVRKSPVLQDYESDVRITTLGLGASTHRYVEDATYTIGGVPVTASATHSAFAPYTVEGKSVDLPTSGEERIAIGSSVLSLSYENVGGKGVGTGTWRGQGTDARPLTYTYDFGKNLAEMRVSLPDARVMILTLRPGMQVESGHVATTAGETIATLVKRSDGTIALRFATGEETTLFE